jgi:hypothetical protein
VARSALPFFDEEGAQISFVRRGSGETRTIPVWFNVEGRKVELLPMYGLETEWFVGAEARRKIGLTINGWKKEERHMIVKDQGLWTRSKAGSEPSMASPMRGDTTPPPRSPWKSLRSGLPPSGYPQRHSLRCAVAAIGLHHPATFIKDGCGVGHANLHSTLCARRDRMTLADRASCHSFTPNFLCGIRRTPPATSSSESSQASGQARVRRRMV